MAGMFSLLRKSQLRLDLAAGSVGAEDLTSDFRKKSNHRSPLPGKRIIRQIPMKAMVGSSDRLPKRFRKRRCSELHPLLRRSVCTLIIAGCGIATGLIIVLLVDRFSNKTISNVGIVVLATSAFVLLVGIGWFWWSSVQLRKFREKLSAMQRENKRATDGNQLYRMQRPCDPVALSASKWPTKRVVPEENSDSSHGNFSAGDAPVPCNGVQTRRLNGCRDFSENIKETLSTSSNDCSHSVESEERVFNNESSTHGWHRHSRTM